MIRLQDLREMGPTGNNSIFQSGYSFACPARSLGEASRQCSHLVMSFPLPRRINAGRFYNWWVMGSVYRSSKVPKVWLFSYVGPAIIPPKGALSFPLLFLHWTPESVLQGQQGQSPQKPTSKHVPDIAQVRRCPDSKHWLPFGYSGGLGIVIY